eukprot:912173-Rhodomonas_salina.3
MPLSPMLHSAAASDRGGVAPLEMDSEQGGEGRLGDTDGDKESTEGEGTAGGGESEDEDKKVETLATGFFKEGPGMEPATGLRVR